MMELHTRSNSRVLDDLVEKLRTLPRNHPDRPHLIRMIVDLSRDIEPSGAAVVPGGAGAR
jgi:hypothetical protein